MKKLLKIVMMLLLAGLLFACSSGSSDSSGGEVDDTKLFDPAECNFEIKGLRLSKGEWKYLEIIRDADYTYTVKYTFEMTSNSIGDAIYKSITEIYEYSDGKQDKKEYTQDELDAMDYTKSRVKKNWNWTYKTDKDQTKFYCSLKNQPDNEPFDGEIYLLKTSK